MREDSHLDDMRAAIRGDFERLAKRRGAQELMREPEEAEPREVGVRPRGSDPTADPVPAAEPLLEPAAERILEPEPQPGPDPAPGPEPHEERRRAPAPPPEPEPSLDAQADEVSAEPEIGEAPRRGFFARLLGL